MLGISLFATLADCTFIPLTRLSDNIWLDWNLVLNFESSRSKRSFNSFDRQLKTNPAWLLKLACQPSFWLAGGFWGLTVLFSSLFWLIILPSFLVLSSSVTAGRRWGIMEFACIAAWCRYALPVAPSTCINHRVWWQKYGGVGGYLQCKHLPPLAAASDVLLRLVLLFITILASFLSFGRW